VFFFSFLMYTFFACIATMEAFSILYQHVPETLAGHRFLPTTIALRELVGVDLVVGDLVARNRSLIFGGDRGRRTASSSGDLAARECRLLVGGERAHGRATIFASESESHVSAVWSSGGASSRSGSCGKRDRDTEEDVYVDNLHSHKRYLTEVGLSFKSPRSASARFVWSGPEFGRGKQSAPFRFRAVSHFPEHGQSEFLLDS
jgi:hypothetical protein